MNCSICKSPISPDEEITKCENCKNDFHLECWSENGGCGTPGCVNLPNVVKSQAAATKTCPACSETIDLGEVVCPFCNERFTTIAPISAEELKNSFTQPKPVIKERKGAI